MKQLLLLAVLALASISVFAQDDETRFRFGIGGALSLPTGDLKEATTFGVGVEGHGLFYIAEQVDAFATVGFNVYKGKSYYGVDEDANSLLHIPLMVGARFKLSGFFVGGGVGYGRWSGGGGSEGGLMYSPQLGYNFGDFDLLGHYTATSITGGTFSSFGLKFIRKF